MTVHAVNYNPELSLDPPEVKKTNKAVTVYVRFAGVDKVEMDVPIDFDLTDSTALTTYLCEWTKEHRPEWSKRSLAPPEDWEYCNLGLGEFWQDSKWNPNRKTFNDPEQGGSQPRIYIEGISED